MSYSIGIDLGGTNIKIVVIANNGDVLEYLDLMRSERGVVDIEARPVVQANTAAPCPASHGQPETAHPVWCWCSGRSCRRPAPS